MNNGDDPHNPQAQNQHDFNAHYAKFVLPDLKKSAQALGSSVGKGERSFASAIDELLAEANRRGLSHLSNGAACLVEDCLVDVLAEYAAGAV
jgi:hypothetical protein